MLSNLSHLWSSLKPQPLVCKMGWQKMYILSWGIVSGQLTKGDMSLHCYPGVTTVSTRPPSFSGFNLWPFSLWLAGSTSVHFLQLRHKPPVIILKRKLKATDSGVDNNGLVLTDLLGKSMGHSNLISPHSLLKMDKARSWSQGPCGNSNFTASMSLDFNSFGIHLWNVISVGSIL